ncbi:MAG: murein biosynthesis integral membrane protein MurJ, partial [Propionibacterium sp.]|nr:murein biosynthesis integral membrane protein MurJ [Propionibacterium sp.]
TLPAVGIIPVAFLLMALARPIVRGIYWGISPAQASVTAPLLMLMAAALLPFTIVTFQQQFCFALERGFTNLWMQCLVTAVQVGFGFAAQRLDPAHGVEIICLGMIAGNSVLAIVFVLYARREMEGIGLARMIWLYLRLAVASLLGATPAYLVGRVVVASQADSLISQFGAMALGAVVFIIGFLIGVKLLAIDEFRAFLRPILRRLHLVRSAE